MKAILSRLFNHEELNRKEAKNLLLNITRFQCINFVFLYLLFPEIL